MARRNFKDNKLAAEALTVLKNAHCQLLEEFAQSKNDETLFKIRAFRVVLSRFGTWADDKGYAELGGQANWWEWYWFEREYGESKFETDTFDIGDGLGEMPIQWACLLAYTIDLARLSTYVANGNVAYVNQIERELDLKLESAETVRSPKLIDILASVEPILRQRLNGAILGGLRLWKPEQSGADFFEFTASIVDKIEVRWRDYLSRFDLALSYGSHRIQRLSQHASNPGATAWLVDRSVATESQTNFRNFLADMLRKAA